MRKTLNNWVIGLGAAYYTACGGQQLSSSNSDNVEEVVHRTHTEEVVVTTRTESEREHTTQRTDGNTTTTDRNLTRNSRERRLRSVETQEGDVTVNSRNVSIDLEGMLAGIRTGTVSRENEEDNTFLNISFSYNGNTYLLSLVDFADEMIGGTGNHVADYIVAKIGRGRTYRIFMRANISDSDFEVTQPARSASLTEYVQVGNVTYRIDFEGGHGTGGSWTNEDIMGMVETAARRFAPEYSIPQND